MQLARIVGRARWISLVAMLIAALSPVTPARAAFEAVVRIAQPHDETDGGGVDGITLMYITYELMLGSSVPGIEIRYTCAPGPVAVDHGNGYSGVKNRNAANLLGFEVSTADWSDPRTWKGTPRSAFVDTMEVTLDLREAERRFAARHAEDDAELVRMYREGFDTTLKCTVECILDNAGRSRPPIRHVKLRVLGPKQYRAYSRVYPVQPSASR